MPHSSLLVINADGPETRVALVQDGYLGELYIERKRERGIAGNIYKGRVERVLPGMQAAFVNIGLEKSAYLHVSDVRGTPDDLKRLLAGESSRPASDEDEDADDAARAGGGARIEDLLKEGQEVIVQVTKEPISTKGARTTRYISLPGRHLVFMPTVDHIGISRRIASDKERRRLRDIVESMRPAGSGFIVRTVAENVSERELKSDMEFLIKLWNEVVRRAASGRCPSLIYNDLDLLLRSVRDLFTADVEKLIIDSRSEYDRVKKFISAFMPDFAGHIELYDGNDPIFDGYGIEIEIDRALERKVWLKSGGYLIVDEMEALTAVDVNTGRFVGKKSLEDTITKTNLEAAQEVAEQLRIRSIGGMIVVDFIDMDRPHNREKVTRAFNEHLRRDRSKAAVTRISELGLIEMTRKRTRESLLHTLTEPCTEWERKAMLAVRSGDDALAKQGLTRKAEHDHQQAEFGKQWQLQKDAVDKLKDQLRTLNDKIEEAKRKKNILIARQKRAEAQKAIQDTMRGLSDNSAFDTFERMHQKVEQIEAESEASTELGGELAGDTLQQKFKALEGSSGSDMALAELKAKMGLGPAPEQPALPEVKSDSGKP